MFLFLSCLLLQLFLLFSADASFGAQVKEISPDNVDKSNPAEVSLPDQNLQPEMLPKEIVNSIGMKLVLIPKGTFTKGLLKPEKGDEWLPSQYEVTLTKDYYLGAMEVTQAQYQKVMGENPSFFQGNEIKGDESLNLQWLSRILSGHFIGRKALQEMAERGELSGRKVGDQWRFERAEIVRFWWTLTTIRWIEERRWLEERRWFEGRGPFDEECLLDFRQKLDAAIEQATSDSTSQPVERVKWEDAVEFCKRLSELPEEKKAGRVYRLPTEAEWEYACRAGSKTSFCFGDDANALTEYGWFKANSRLRTHPVGSKKPNAWGLYDMHGNVSEWCSDWLGPAPKEPVRDPTGPEDGEFRISPGGAWNNNALECRSAGRFGIPWQFVSDDLGFRVALSTPIIPKSATGLPKELAKELVNSIDMKLVLIPNGTFMMGPESAEGKKSGKSKHQVMLTNDFYLGVTEVTQAQYQKVMGENPSKNQGDNNPVEKVLWRDAVEFCKRLSELPEEKKAGRVYRLPTEAEWEYACRAGSTTAFCFGDDDRELPEYANRDSKTIPVGSRKPNVWGLYDMHGNVWEWCSDWYGDYPEKLVTDPTGPSKGKDHVARGGSFANPPNICRSASRFSCTPEEYYFDLGFRVALSVPKN